MVESGSPYPVGDPRSDEVRRNLASVRRRIAEACEAAGRTPRDITLVAVTKFFPATDAALLFRAGVTDLGESRDQEASVKARQVAELLDSSSAGPRPRWHFVGRLQTNKARSVARYADVVHSVDRLELVAALAAGAEQAQRSIEVLIQLSLDGDTSRGGALATDLEALADAISAHVHLILGGVMAIAPMDADPDEAFSDLAAASERLRERRPAASVISAGMSGDLEAAIRQGATHVRIGTALLGRRSAQFS